MEKLTVLLVDDENLTRRALIQGIKWDEIGIGSVLEAGSSAQAKEVLQNEKPDLALIDVEMPGESGIELLEWIRKEYSRTLPCSFLTCHASFNYAQNAMRLGSFDYVLKPVDFKEIEDLILRMIGRQREVREADEISKFGRQWLEEREKEGKKHEKTAISTEEIVDETIVYIRSHLSQKLSLSELAHDAGLNPNYFNKVFKERAGDTVNQFIIKEKMNLAARLLKEGNLKSYAIAESLGYDNYANFVNMFKKTFGRSPNAYAEENR